MNVLKPSAWRSRPCLSKIDAILATNGFSVCAGSARDYYMAVLDGQPPLVRTNGMRRSRAPFPTGSVWSTSAKAQMTKWDSPDPEAEDLTGRYPIGLYYVFYLRNSKEHSEAEVALADRLCGELNQYVRASRKVVRASDSLWPEYRDLSMPFVYIDPATTKSFLISSIALVKRFENIMVGVSKVVPSDSANLIITRLTNARPNPTNAHPPARPM